MDTKIIRGSSTFLDIAVDTKMIFASNIQFLEVAVDMTFKLTF